MICRNPVYKEGELVEKMVVSKMEITTRYSAIPSKIQSKETNFYGPDAIVSVGYHINFSKTTQFRIQATGITKEHTKKGFVCDDDRLKQGNYIGCILQILGGKMGCVNY